MKSIFKAILILVSLTILSSCDPVNDRKLFGMSQGPKIKANVVCYSGGKKFFELDTTEYADLWQHGVIIARRDGQRYAVTGDCVIKSNGRLN